MYAPKRSTILFAFVVGAALGFCAATIHPSSPEDVARAVLNESGRVVSPEYVRMGR